MLKRRTVTSDVADFIRQKIIEGTYKSGELVRQEALATELGVSRIPVREALLQLEAEGLVTIQTHRGAMVAILSPEDAREIFEARALFEPYLLREAMKLSTPADIEAVQQVHARYEKAIRNDAGPEELSSLNWALHTRMCEPARRPRTMAILTSLHNSADRYLRVQINVEEARKRALVDHQNIVDAYAAGDAKKACKLMEQHIRLAMDEVMERLKRLSPGD